MELPKRGRLVTWIWEPRPESRPVAGADMKSFNDIPISVLVYKPNVNVSQWRIQLRRHQIVRIRWGHVAIELCCQIPWRTERVHHQVFVRVPVQLLGQSLHPTSLLLVDDT